MPWLFHEITKKKTSLERNIPIVELVCSNPKSRFCGGMYSHGPNGGIHGRQMTFLFIHSRDDIIIR